MPASRALDFSVVLALPPDEVPALFAELASGSFLPIPGDRRMFGFRGTCRGNVVSLHVRRVSRYAWMGGGAQPLRLEGTIGPYGSLSILNGRIGVERDRGGIVVGVAVTILLAAAIAWQGTTDALLLAFAALLLAAGMMAVGWILWEATALAQVDQVRRALEAVRPLGEHP